MCTWRGELFAGCWLLTPFFCGLRSPTHQRRWCVVSNSCSQRKRDLSWETSQLANDYSFLSSSCTSGAHLSKSFRDDTMPSVKDADGLVRIAWPGSYNYYSLSSRRTHHYGVAFLLHVLLRFCRPARSACRPKSATGHDAFSKTLRCCYYRGCELTVIGTG